MVEFLASAVIASAQCRALTATYYSDWYEGRTMANGQTFRQTSDSIATNDYPLGTRLRITYQGRSITGIVRDRMSRAGRVDLTTSSFRRLAPLRQGVARVRVCVL